MISLFIPHEYFDNQMLVQLFIESNITVFDQIFDLEGIEIFFDGPSDDIRNLLMRTWDYGRSVS